MEELNKNKITKAEDITNKDLINLSEIKISTIKISDGYIYRKNPLLLYPSYDGTNYSVNVYQTTLHASTREELKTIIERHIGDIWNNFRYKNEKYMSNIEKDLKCCIKRDFEKVNNSKSSGSNVYFIVEVKTRERLSEEPYRVKSNDGTEFIIFNYWKKVEIKHSLSIEDVQDMRYGYIEKRSVARSFAWNIVSLAPFYIEARVVPVKVEYTHNFTWDMDNLEIISDD